MRTRQLHGVDVPIVGLGTWNMERDDAGAAEAALRRGIERGLTHIDTAEMYGSGACEQIVARAIAGQREKVFLVSKVLPRNASFRGTLKACEASLKRLGTDHLDCYLLHWRGNEPLAETFRAFAELTSQGKIRSWGVSNFDDADLDEALAIVGEGQIACNQVLYHLQERSIEHRVLPWCDKHGVAVVAYSPFGSGAFKSNAALDGVAKRLNATPRQVALAFLARRTFVIPKTSSVAHVEELAVLPTLDDAAVDAIAAAYPVPKWRGLPSL